MIVQASKVIDLNIVTLKKGQVVGQVKDILYSPDEKIVKGLLIRDKGLFNDAEVILIKDIKSIGEDAVIVHSQYAVRKADEVDESTRQLAQSSTFLTQTNVLTESGTELGSISDMFFDIPTGTVDAFEVSQGGFANLATGKKRIVVNDIVTVGKDHLIVRAYTEEVMKHQEGGVTGAAKQASRTVKRRAPEVFDDVRSRAGALGGAAQSSFNEFKDDPKTQHFIAKTKTKAEQVKREAAKVAEKVERKIEDTIDVGDSSNTRKSKKNDPQGQE